MYFSKAKIVWFGWGDEIGFGGFVSVNVRMILSSIWVVGWLMGEGGCRLRSWALVGEKRFDAVVAMKIWDMKARTAYNMTGYESKMVRLSIPPVVDASAFWLLLTPSKAAVLGARRCVGSRELPGTKVGVTIKLFRPLFRIPFPSFLLWANVSLGMTCSARASGYLPCVSST